MLKFNKDNFLLAEFSNDAVVFSLITNIPYIVNKTGLMVLKLCNGNRDKRAIIKKVAEAYRIEAKAIRIDINTIITKYKELKILK